MKALGIRLTKFGLVGLANTAVGFSVILLCLALGVNDYAANAAGYLCGLALSFVLNRRFTFERRGSVGRTEVMAFAATALAAYVCNIVVLTLGLKLLGEGSALAQLAANVVYTATFFLLSSRFVFRERMP